MGGIQGGREAVGVVAIGKKQWQSRIYTDREVKYLFAVFGNQSMSLEQKQARIEQLHVATQSNLWGLLTHEQRKQLSEQPRRNRLRRDPNRAATLISCNNTFR